MDDAIKTVQLSFVFDSEPDDTDLDCMSTIAAEINGDLPSGWLVNETYLVIPPPEPIHRLRELAFLRFEGSK